jgi:AraC-like DNA-binding protein
VDFLIAPLLLLYAWTLTDPARAPNRRDLLHAIPFVVATLILLPYYSLSGAEKLAVLDDGLPRSLILVIGLKILVAIAYVSLTIRHLSRAFAKSPETRDPQVVWFFRAMVVLVVVALVSVVVAIAPGFGVQLPFDSDEIGTLFLCASIYLICFVLIRHPFVSSAKSAVSGASVGLVTSRPKYGTSPLTPEQKQEFARRLVRYMDNDRPFRDMQLNLERLSGALQIAPSHLSQVLNEQIGMNFYEFVNEYRVRDVMKRINLGSDGTRTMLALAFESGFNSKASFNRAFKRVTGITPTDYARRGTADMMGASIGD